MTIRADMVNGHDIGHGGLTFALADSAFACACNSHGPVTVAAGASIRFRSCQARRTPRRPGDGAQPRRSTRGVRRPRHRWRPAGGAVRGPRGATGGGLMRQRLGAGALALALLAGCSGGGESADPGEKSDSSPPVRCPPGPRTRPLRRRERAGRGRLLPPRRRPRRGLAALRTRPDVGAEEEGPHRHRDGDVPRDQGRPALPARPRRPARRERRQGRRRGRPLPPPGQEPRRRRPGQAGPGVRRADPLRRQTRAGPGAHAAFGLHHHRPHRHRRGRGVDDAGAVRCVHVVPRQRPALGQGALRLHAPGEGPVGGRRERHADLARGGGRADGHAVPPGRARVVVPDHPRVRRVRPRDRRDRVGNPAQLLGSHVDAGRDGPGAAHEGRARVGRGEARRLPVLVGRDAGRAEQQRDGDADPDHARQQRVHAQRRGAGARAGPPVVRRPGRAARLARRVAQRGHHHVPAVALPRRGQRGADRPDDRRGARDGPAAAHRGAVRRRRTTPRRSATQRPTCPLGTPRGTSCGAGSATTPSGSSSGAGPRSTGSAAPRARTWSRTSRRRPARSCRRSSTRGCSGAGRPREADRARRVRPCRACLPAT